MPTITRQDLEAARSDIEVFARLLIGEPLFEHQVRLATDPARIRCVVAGRQAGKTRALSMMAAHEAFSRRKARIMIVSSGEVAAKRLFADIAELVTGSALLGGSVLDETTSILTLSNGSVIEAVPASIKQIRSASIDLLIVDEAAFLDEAIFAASKWTTVARRRSRLVLASSPWGSRDRFFAAAYDAGLRGAEGYSSHHWPSTINPLVDESLIEQFKVTMTEREYRMEVLGEWVDAQGAWFTPAELEAAKGLAGDRGFEIIDPFAVHVPGGERIVVDAGVDWGFAPDSNALVTIGVVPSWVPWHRPGLRWVPYVVERKATAYEQWIDEIVELGRSSCLRFGRVAAESNGVGQMPSQVLRRRLIEAGAAGAAVAVTTTGVRKEAAFSALKLEIQRGCLALPQEPALLRQLAALEYEQLDGGGLRIRVPERRGHDDLAMALALAVMPEVEAAQAWQWAPPVEVGHYRVGHRDRGTVSSTTWLGSDAESRARLERARAMVRSGARETGSRSSPSELEDRARRLAGFRSPRRGAGR
jgi:hypothetical protein